MLTELTRLFDNVKKFRFFINEGVGESDIREYIENHEWVYIYYNGDDKVSKGYRTIRPYVLGTSTSGNLVIRAWQDNPKNSWHFTNRATRIDSEFHDFWIEQGSVKPGWRLFRLDKISKIFPTGKKFVKPDGSVMIPPGYREGADDNMENIISYVSTSKEPEVKANEPETDTNLSRNEINKIKWDSIRRGVANKRKITSDDVLKLSNIASQVFKKNKGTYLIAIDDKNEYQLITHRDKERYGIPDTAIVGGLANLYDTMVKKNKPVDDKFFNNVKNTLISKEKNEINELPTIPYNKKTFFK